MELGRIPTLVEIQNECEWNKFEHNQAYLEEDEVKI